MTLAGYRGEDTVVPPDQRADVARHMEETLRRFATIGGASEKAAAQKPAADRGDCETQRHLTPLAAPEKVAAYTQPAAAQEPRTRA